MEFLFAGLVSAFVACVIFATKPDHLKYTAKGHSGAARQAAHRTSTPSIGGIAIFWLYRGDSDVAVLCGRIHSASIAKLYRCICRGSWR